MNILTSISNLLKPTTPIEKFWQGVKYNDADKLGVIIKPTVLRDKPYAEAVVVHLLTAQENNHGNHNLYLDCIDEQGKQLRGSVLKGDNNGIKLEVRVDKPTHEFGTNFSMFSQDTLSCWVDEVPGIGKVASDVVSGFHTRWGGEKVGGQDWGHVSFYVIFLIRPAGTPPIIIPPITGDEYQRGIEEGQRILKVKIQDLLNRL